MTTIVVYLGSPADEKRSFGEPRLTGQLCFRWSRARRYRSLFLFTGGTSRNKIKKSKIKVILEGFNSQKRGKK